MKLTTISGDTVIELSDRDIAAPSRVIRELRPGVMVYTPIEDRPAVFGQREHARQPERDLEDCAIVRAPKPDSHRLDRLRAALAGRGLALQEIDAPFYARIVRAATGRASRLSEAQP